MGDYLEALKNQNNVLTENGAVTHSSTNSDCLDLFFQIGALRGTGRDPYSLFMRAFIENPTVALKILFFSRDVRGGVGERATFRTILQRLAVENPEVVKKNFAYIAELGRFDDWLCLLDTPCSDKVFAEIKSQLTKDLDALKQDKEISLLAKWLPSINATNAKTVKDALRISKALGMKPVEYRKTLSVLRRKLTLVENNLRLKDYTFAYEHVPSKALFRYRNAFIRNDEKRYENFLNRAKEQPSIMHTGTLEPYDIIAPFFNDFEKPDEKTLQTLVVTWNALKDYTGDENALVVMDGSGSMYSTYSGNIMPIAIAMSLAIYFAERNKGMFHNHFITFSMNPQLVEIKGKTIYDKVCYCSNFNDACNTDLERTFILLLNAAVANNISQEEMPSRLYIISDMEFDSCVEGCNTLTNFEVAKKMFAEAGYKLPEVVFWNVSARQSQFPVRQHESGVALVSGFTPRIFASIQSNVLNPYNMMLEILDNPRYQGISA